MKITILLLVLLAVTMITGCATQASQATGQAYYPYSPPPGVQQNPNPPPQPSAQGYGCGI